MAAEYINRDPSVPALRVRQDAGTGARTPALSVQSTSTVTPALQVKSGGRPVFEVGANGAVGHAVRCYRSGGPQGITDATDTVIDLTATEYNDDPAGFTVALAANTITVVRAGLYFCSWEVGFTGGSPGERVTSLLVDGGSARQCGSPAAATGEALLIRTSGSAILRLNAGQVLSLGVYVSGGTGASVRGTQVFDTGLTIAHLGG